MIGLRLCGIADEPFWPAAERLLDLADLGAREVPDLGREAVDRGGDDRERREQLGVAVALEDLGRARRRLEAEPLAGDALDLGIRGGIGSDGARQLADAQSLDRAAEALAVAVDAERPARQLEPEGRRLGVDPVRAPHADRLAVLLRAGDDGAEGAIETLEQVGAGVLDRERERRVEDVRGGEPVVEEATVRAEPLGDRVDERRHVVVRLELDLGHPLRRRHDRALADRLHGLDGNDADLGPAVQGGQLDVQPAPQLLAVRPDVAHGRAGVAGDHEIHSTRRPGAPDGSRVNPTGGHRHAVCRRRPGVVSVQA